MSRDELVSGLVRISERLLTGEDEAEVDAYFAPGYRFLPGHDVGTSEGIKLEISVDPRRKRQLRRRLALALG